MKFDLNKILDVVKRRWVVISLSVVMVIAMIAVPTFVSSQQTALQTVLDGKKTLFDKISALMSKQRHAPVVSIDPDAVAPNLPTFPNQQYIEAGMAAIKRVEEQSLSLKDTANAKNIHYVLVPGSLPQSNDPFKFQQVYLQQFQTAIPSALQSATPPTDEEIKIRADVETARLTKDAPQNTATGEIFNKEVLQQAIATKLKTLPEEMRVEAATKHKLYLAPGVLSIQPELSGTTGIPPDMDKVWLAQVGLWVQQDVVLAIVKLNSNSRKVETSPVKQIVQIYIAPNTSMYVIPAPLASAGMSPGAGPVSSVATNTDTDVFPKDYSVSPTGRVSNGVFDVVQFMVVLQVQASDVERVIQELERNRLITVTQIDIQAVNSVALQQQGFYFGKTGVVTLTMKCEELFMRDWTKKLMPSAIKTFLNVDQTGQTGQPPVVQ